MEALPVTDWIEASETRPRVDRRTSVHYLDCCDLTYISRLAQLTRAQPDSWDTKEDY
jgi:hypothetical protein